ncbi:uncharacterized protein Z519_08933 [Cladophialophora bantiana CBS 173.52]|uniref:FAD/NAD(P)-binding domain-containing protein n=1 Tax=Cladophialophora bantiana (strain ATCC 10958 / CBS 173.52 / CDC B-1940 / NIH 8579) TaxID=1442370 RepID=A0A0D2I079_CLAB1|nr:uncharacterized protein Z519_08933 [Cladophialophora bantiana CBS 173.52]KIW90289.1 hypothetical protein Z519_08933 [Cladophialophora bantiana CBS 173.52]
MAVEMLSVAPVAEPILTKSSNLTGKEVKDDLGFDPDALKAKYLAEREKRIRANPNGVEQYRAIEGSLSHYLDDPWAGQNDAREPLDITTEVVIIGAGYGGELMAHHLKENGIEDFKIIEKGADFGGVWYWNRYPGVQCDIESYVYMPMLDHVGYIPKEKYARGPELLGHAQKLARELGLYEKAIFKTEILSIHWQEESATYSIKTNHNDKIEARFVVGVAGSLHRPKLPGFPGIETFKGHSFHSSRWDYKYTGGDATGGGLVNLTDKRVAIVGTGATAVQIVPNIAPWCKKLYVFQRTPSSIDVRNNRPTDPEWAKSLRGKWQKERMDNFNTIVCGGHQDVDLVNDGWTDIIRNLYPSREATGTMGKEEMAKRRQILDFQKMEQIRKRVNAIVKDPATAESLKPYYNQFCKRPCFHDEYLESFNRPNVQLVDTKGQGIERLTERGVVANGEEFEIDCLIYATGFERATSWSHRAGMEVYGRDRKMLGEKFSDGPSTFQGWVSKDFPNFFMITTLQAFVTANFLHTTAIQAEHLAYVVAECRKRNIRSIEPTQEAEDKWVETIIESGVNSRAFHMECTPGYYNNEGQITRKLAKNQWYGGSPLWVINMLREWREAGKLEGLTATFYPESDRS